MHRHKNVLATATVVLAIWGSLAAPAKAQADLFVETGQARAIEGDTLVVNDRVTHLYGVAAPLRVQPCLKNNVNVACGIESQMALQALLDAGPVTCKQVRDTSFRRRFLNFARCEMSGLDLAAELIAQGMAMAFPEQSDEYVALEEAAAAAGKGHWASDKFEAPWIWEENARTQ